MEAFGLAGLKIGLWNVLSGLYLNHNARRMWQLQNIERIILKGNIHNYFDITKIAHTV